MAENEETYDNSVDELEGDSKAEPEGEVRSGLLQVDEDVDYDAAGGHDDSSFMSFVEPSPMGLCTLFEEEDLVTIGEIARYWLQMPKNQDENSVQITNINETVLSLCEQSLKSLLDLCRSCPLRFFADQLKISPHTLCITMEGKVVALDIQIQPTGSGNDSWDFFDAPERHDIQLQHELINISNIFTKQDEENAIRTFAARCHLYSLGLTLKTIWDLRFFSTPQEENKPTETTNQFDLEKHLAQLLNKLSHHNAQKRPESLAEAYEEIRKLYKTYFLESPNVSSQKLCANIAINTFNTIFTSQLNSPSQDELMNESQMKTPMKNDLENFSKASLTETKVSNLDLEDKDLTGLSKSEEKHLVGRKPKGKTTATPGWSDCNAESESDDEGTYEINSTSERELSDQSSEEISKDETSNISNSKDSDLQTLSDTGQFEPDGSKPQQDFNFVSPLQPVELRKSDLIEETTDNFSQDHKETNSADAEKLKAIDNYATVNNVLVYSADSLTPEPKIPNATGDSPGVVKSGGPRLTLRLEGKWSKNKNPPEGNPNLTPMVPAKPRRTSNPEKRQKPTKDPRSKARDPSPFPTQKQNFTFDASSLKKNSPAQRQSESNASSVSPRNPIENVSTSSFAKTTESTPKQTFKSSVQLPMKAAELPSPVIPKNPPPRRDNVGSKSGVNERSKVNAAVSFLSKAIQGEIEKERSTPTSSIECASSDTSVEDLWSFSSSRNNSFELGQITPDNTVPRRNSESNSFTFSSTQSHKQRQFSTNSPIPGLSKSPTNARKDLYLSSPPPFSPKTGKSALRVFYNLGNAQESSRTSLPGFKRSDPRSSPSLLNQTTMNVETSSVYSSPKAHAPVYAQTLSSRSPIPRAKSIDGMQNQGPQVGLDKYLEKLVKARSSEPPNFTKTQTQTQIPVGLAHKQVRSGSTMSISSSLSTPDFVASVRQSDSFYESHQYFNQSQAGFTRFEQQIPVQNMPTNRSVQLIGRQSLPSYISVNDGQNMRHIHSPTPQMLPSEKQPYHSINVSRKALQKTQFRIQNDCIQLVSPEDGRETTIHRNANAAPVEIEIGRGGVNISFGGGEPIFQALGSMSEMQISGQQQPTRRGRSYSGGQQSLGYYPSDFNFM